jgi:hypothetical protein
MSNFEWFKDYGNRKKLPLNIPVCPLTQNWNRIPEIIRFANKNNVSVNFVYVDRPFSLALSYSTPEFFDNILEHYRLEKFENVSPFSGINIKRFKGLMDDISKWKENSLRSVEPALQGDLMQLLREKIMNSSEIEEKADAQSKREMISKIENMLNEISPEKHNLILKVFHGYSTERLHHFLTNKSTREVVVFFKEYVGG